MSRLSINIGTEGNDGTGDSIRESFRKVNENFQELYAAFGQGDQISFLDLGDTPTTYIGNDDKIPVVGSVSATEKGLVFKSITGGPGISISSTGTSIVITGTGTSSLITDTLPRLANHLNAKGFLVGNVRDPDVSSVADFNSIHSTSLTVDNFAITKGYADARYVNVLGDTMQSTLYLYDHPGAYAGSNPADAFAKQAATKYYVDANISVVNNSITSNVSTLNSNITATNLRIDNTESDINDLSNNISNISLRIDGVDTRIDGVDTRITNLTTTNIAEGINQYFTNNRARIAISVTDAGGDGSLSYNNTTGVFTYTGPSAAETRSHFSSGTNINYNTASGVISTVPVPSFTSVTLTGTPSNSTDAVSKDYVDNAISGLTWKDAVNILANSNVILTGSTGTLALDGELPLTTASNGFRLLLTAQTNLSENGIYVYQDNGTTYTLTRAGDANTLPELASAAVLVVMGTQYGNTGWVQSNNSLSNFTDQLWVQFTGVGNYTAGNGLQLFGVQFSHADTSTVNDLTTSNIGNEFIQNLSLTFDTFGHVTGVSTTTNSISVNNSLIQLVGGYGIIIDDGSGNPNQTNVVEFGLNQSAGATFVLTHEDTSSVGDLISSNTNNRFIQSISFEFDDFGHVVAASTSTNDVVIGNGTLTLNVSGNGLSGSQTFTANQDTAATFTVTSNATNANTANTIVYRDASGNFSAGTITSNLTGNVTGNATTADKVNNALTINGNSYDGSSAVNLTITGPTGPTGPQGAATYDIFNFVNGKPLVNEVLMRAITVRVYTIAANFAGSLAYCTTGATTPQTINILKNGSLIGTVTFGIGSTTGTFAGSPSGVTMNIGDQLQVQMTGASQDASFSDIAFTIKGTSI